MGSATPPHCLPQNRNPAQETYDQSSPNSAEQVGGWAAPVSPIGEALRGTSSSPPLAAWSEALPAPDPAARLPGRSPPAYLTLLSTGTQSLVPPSLHSESGERREWCRQEPAPEMSSDEGVKAAADIATAALCSPATGRDRAHAKITRLRLRTTSDAAYPESAPSGSCRPPSPPAGTRKRIVG